MSLSQLFQFQAKVPVHLEPNAFACVNVFDKYAKRRQIGQGTYGEVWLAQDRQTNEFVAIKKIKVDGNKEKRQGFPVTAIREIRVLQRLKHKNLVELKEVSRSNGAFMNVPRELAAEIKQLECLITYKILLLSCSVQLQWLQGICLSCVRVR